MFDWVRNARPISYSDSNFCKYVTTNARGCILSKLPRGIYKKQNKSYIMEWKDPLKSLSYWKQLIVLNNGFMIRITTLIEATSFHYQFIVKKVRSKKKTNSFSKLYGPFLWIWFKCRRATVPLRGDTLLFTIMSSEILGFRLIRFGRMKGWVNLGATHWLWNRDSWAGNPVP